MTPRVALMVQRFLPHLGGLERWADALARALVARGRPVRIVTTEADAAPAGVAIARVPAAAGLMAQARLFADAVAGSGDIVHDTGIGLGADLFQPQMGSRLLNLDRDVAQWPWRRRLRLAVSPGYARLRRDIAARAPAPLRPLYASLVDQAGQVRRIIASFGRHPHRNAILGRRSTPEEEAYLEKGAFPHLRVFRG